MKRIIRLTESDLTRIVRKVMMEQISSSLEGLKITKLIITPERKLSMVTLSNGETYMYSEGNNYKLPSMGYSYQCKPGEYNGNQLPQYCSVSITLKDNTEYTCDSNGCIAEPTKY